MSTYKSVLVALDLIPWHANQILSRTLQFADKSEIEAVHVCQDHILQNRALRECEAPFLAQRRDEQLDRICHPFGINRACMYGRSPATVIHQEAKNNFDLVVVGQHQAPWWQRIFGSTTQEMLHDTPCDVLAVKLQDQEQEPQGATCYKKVLAAVDLTDRSYAVLDQAQQLACRSGADIEVCHIMQYYQPAMEHKLAMDCLVKMTQDYGIREDRLSIGQGFAAEQIIYKAEQNDFDLVVLGTNGRRGIELLSGSTSNDVLPKMVCDTLSVRLF